MVDGWWERAGGTYGGGWHVDGARRLGHVDVGESGVWGCTMRGGGAWAGCGGGPCTGAGGYALMGPGAHGGSLGHVDSVRDAWGLRVYVLVGARRIEEGGMRG